MTKKLKSNDVITVAHGGRTYLASVYPYGGGSWIWFPLWPFTVLDGSNVLVESDEDFSWTRKKLFHWWPFHRAAIRGLLTAAALSPPTVTAKRVPGLRVKTSAARRTFKSDWASLNKDIDKIMKDANKLLADAEKLTKL